MAPPHDEAPRVSLYLRGVLLQFALPLGECAVCAAAFSPEAEPDLVVIPLASGMVVAHTRCWRTLRRAVG